MGARLARSASLIASVAAALIGLYLIFRPAYNPCPSRVPQDLCLGGTPLWKVVTPLDFPLTFGPIILWSVMPLMALREAFEPWPGRLRSVALIGLALAIEVTAFVNLNYVQLTLRNGGRINVNFGYYYATFVVPFLALALVGSLAAWAGGYRSFVASRR